MSCDEICLYSPSSILECEERDVFDEAVPAGAAHDTLCAMLWAEYRYSLISSCCLDRWVQKLKDRATLVQRRYQTLIDLYEDNLSKVSELGSLETTTYDTKVSDAVTVRDLTQTQSEKIPQVSGASSQTWLSDRGQTITEAGNNASSTTTGTVSVSGVDGVSKSLREAMDVLKVPYEDYVYEFRDLFLNRWSMS